jgi:hypothetical protein
MAYGEIKVDTITFTDGGVDKSISISGLVQNPTFSGDITVTGTISGNTLRGQTVSGITVTGATAAFTSGTFISLTGTTITGTTIQGTTATYTTGVFTSLTGTTTTGVTATFTTGSFTSLTGTTTTGVTATFTTGSFTLLTGTTTTGVTTTFTTGSFTSLTGGVFTATSGVFALGSASTPSITFTGDLNTGIYSPGADQWAIATSGTLRLNVASNGVVTAKNGAVAEIGTLTDGATITPDFAANCNFTVTLGGNRTIANPTNITAGQSGSIFLVQDATGSRTLSWGSYWDFSSGTAPTLSTTANAVDRIDYIVRSATSIHTVFTSNYS